MKIRQRLISGFLIITLLFGAAVFLSFVITKTILQKVIGNNTVHLTDTILSEIDRGIYSRIVEIEDETTDIFFKKIASASNEEFDKIPDVQDYINTIDRDWKDKKDTPLIKDILNNEVSMRLTTHYELNKQKYGYEVFTEMYVTNKYGVIVGSTGRTSDFLQADEEWYQKAVKEKLFWVGDVEYDESSDAYSIDIVLNLYDENGKFLGIFKGALNLEDIRNTIVSLRSRSEYKSMETYLVDKNGLIIFSSLKPSKKEIGRDIKLKEYGMEISSRESFNQAIKGKNGYILGTTNGKEILTTFSHSMGFKDFKGLKWSLIVDFDANELFSPINKTNNILFILFGITVIAIVLVGSFISSSISKPIAKLKKASIEIGEGKLDTQIDIKSKDEIGILARSFNKMAEDLMQITISKDHVNNIFNGMRESLIVMTPEGMIQTVNQATCKLLGYKENELIGKPIEMICGKEGQFETINIDDIKKGNVQNIEITYLSSRGKNIAMLFSGTVMSSNDSDIKGIICVAQDITEQKRAEDQILKLSHAIEQGPTTVMITDIKGDIEYVNPRFTETTGYAREEAIGKNPRILKSGEQAPEVYKKLWDTICSGGEWRGELRNKRKNGELYWEFTSISPVRNRKDIITHFIAVKEDITARKQLEQLQKNTVEEREQTIRSLKQLMEFSSLLREEVLEVELIKHMAQALKENFNPDVIAVLMLNREKDVIDVPLIEPQMPVDKLIKSETFLNPSICRVLRTGKELIVMDVNKDIPCECISLEIKEGGYACYPLITGGVTTGVVLLVKKEMGGWDGKEKQSLFSTYIGLVASALHSVRLMDMTRHAAVTDGLTGVYNRRFFDEMLEKQILLAKRRKVSLSLFIMDIDHFKSFNDTYGHIAGDRVLKQLTTSVSNSIRESDFLARYGGEEFVVIMPDAGLSNASKKANKIRRNVESMKLDNIVSGQSLEMTISIGVASFPEHGTKFSTLVTSADSALYKAKEGGRNRVETP